MRVERRSFNIFDEFVYKSFDFDLIQLNVIYDEKRDIFKGLDIVEIFFRSFVDSQDRLNIDFIVCINKYINVIVELLFVIQIIWCRVFFELKMDLRFNIYVNEQGIEVDSNLIGVYVYVNEK